MAHVLFTAKRYPSLQNYVDSKEPKNIEDIDRAVAEYMRARTAWY